MPIDISGLSFFMPVFGFLFVFVIIYALLIKTKILGGSLAINFIVSFVIAFIFATMSSAQEYVQKVTPWFVILVIILFFILIIIGLSQLKIGDIMKPGFVWIFIAALLLVFLIAAITVFSSFGEVWYGILNFVTLESRIAGAIILLIIALIVAWIIVKK
jgi:hypothetical protein